MRRGRSTAIHRGESVAGVRHNLFIVVGIAMPGYIKPLIASALIISAATPALARSHRAEDAEVARAAARLNDPAIQRALSGTMGALIAAMMDVRIDGIKKAIRPLAGGHADDDADNADNDKGRAPARTLGDVMARDDPQFRDHMVKQTDRAVGMMGAAATGMAAMLPQLRDAAERIARQMARAANNIPLD
jgi:hypothetical protein